MLRRLEKVNGIPIVRFLYAPGTKEDDKISRDLLRVHFAVASIYHAMGGAEVVDLKEDDEEGICRLPTLACYPEEADSHMLWSDVLHAKLSGIPV